MHLKEIRSRVESYRKNELGERESTMGFYNAELFEKMLEAEEKLRLQTTEARAHMVNFRVTDLLNAIKREVWREGRLVTETIKMNKPNGGLVDTLAIQLVANEIPVLKIKPSDEKPDEFSLSPKQIKPALGVGVFLEDDTHTNPMFVVWENDQVATLKMPFSSIGDTMKHKPLNAGVSTLIPRMTYPEPRYISNGRKLNERLMEAVYQHVEDIDRDVLKAPSVIRLWSESILSELPDDFRKSFDAGEEIDTTRLLEWQYELRGTPGLLRRPATLLRRAMGTLY
jgi:hypothetical protein